jgi:hypothetical protein
VHLLEETVDEPMEVRVFVLEQLRDVEEQLGGLLLGEGFPLTEQEDIFRK